MKLEKSGYNKHQIKEIMESGVVGHGRRIRKQGEIIHRRCSDGILEGADKKLNGKTTGLEKQKTQKDKTRQRVAEVGHVHHISVLGTIWR